MTFGEVVRRSEELTEEKLCPFCQEVMQFHDSEMSRWRKPKGEVVTYINNVTLKCAKCKFLARFGIQVSKEWFEDETKLRGAVKTISIFDRFFTKEPEDAIQRKRLEALGYL